MRLPCRPGLVMPPQPALSFLLKGLSQRNRGLAPGLNPEKRDHEKNTNGVDLSAPARPLGRPVLPVLPWWTREGSSGLGWQLSFDVSYQYSEDLNFSAGYTHYFVDTAIKDGAFLDEAGTVFVGGFDEDDVEYVYGMVTIEF